jgi:anti-sigma factor RsiW
MMETEMECAEARLYLLDDQRGRLAVALAGPLAAHLAGCAACAREDQAERLLTEQLERRLPQHAAPIALKRRLAAEWPAPTQTARRRAFALRPAAVFAALVLVAALAGMAVAVRLARPSASERLVAEAVTDHLRLVARADALDVRSGDVHQLRPWLSSRLDFAPVIAFAGDAEFPLRGGTTEYFLDRRAGAAVYGRRLHLITLLVVGRVDDLGWPAAGQPLTTRARGFNVRLWQAGGLGYALVSDVDATELARFAARLGG